MDNWSEDEISIVCALYLCPIKGEDKDCQMLEEIGVLPGRSKNAIQLKMGNLKRCNPAYTSIGQTGLSHGSKLDQTVWEKFQNNPNKMFGKVNYILKEHGCEYDLFNTHPELKDILDDNSILLEGGYYNTETKIRMGQYELRNEILRLANYKCCLTGIACNELLVASHIKPWSQSTDKEKVDVHNVLCLNKFHDGLFDKYLMTINEDMNVIYASNLKKMLGSEVYDNWIKPYNKINVSKDNKPSICFINYHNQKFIEKTGEKIN